MAWNGSSALVGAGRSLAPISAPIAAVILLRVAVNVTTRLAAEKSPRNRSRSAPRRHHDPLTRDSPRQGMSRLDVLDITWYTPMRQRKVRGRITAGAATGGSRCATTYAHDHLDI